MQHHLKISNFYFAIIYTGLLLLSVLAHANPCNEGIGGTGNTIETEGLGGTGISAKSDGLGGTGISAKSDGLGGTGISAKSDGLGGTGIVGVITGFASVCVNGVEAHFDSNTKVDIDGVASSVDKLNIGELVAIDAKGQGGQVAAQRISVVHAIVGRVDNMSSTRQQITVLGRRVELSAITQGVNNLKVGQNVAISGFVNASANIQAVRIDKVADNLPSLVTGPLLNGKILGVPVNMPSRHQAKANVQASGNWDGKTLTVVDVKQNAMDLVMHAGYAFNAQGIVYQSSNSQTLYTLGKPVYIDASTKIYGNKNLSHPLVIVRGQVDSGGRAVAKDLEYRPMDKMLERGGSQQLPARSSHENDDVSKDVAESKKQEQDAEKGDHKKGKVEKPNENEKPEKIETPDKIDKLEKIEKPEKVEKIEKIEKSERIEKPERVEKLERIEKIDKSEVPEKPEKYTY